MLANNNIEVNRDSKTWEKYINAKLVKPTVIDTNTQIRGNEIPFVSKDDKALYLKFKNQYKSFAKVSKGGKAFIVKEYVDGDGARNFQFQSHRDFKDFHIADNFYIEDTQRGQTNHKRVFMAETWLMESELSKSFIDCVFEPNPDFSNPDYYNYWRGYIEPIEGDVAPFLDFINRLIDGSQSDKEYVIKLLAWVFQNPHISPEVMLLLKGLQGGGKTTLYEICKAMCPAHSYSTAKIKNILGFNAHTHHSKIIGLEEAFSDGNRFIQNEFKHFITGKERDIEGKGLDQRSVKNIIFYIATSNEERPVSIESDDRRHAVFDCLIAGDEDYFSKFYTWLHKEQGANHILQYLLSINLTGFNRKDIPVTRAKIEVKKHSGNSVEKFIMEFLSDTYIDDLEVKWADDTQIVRSDLYTLYTDSHGGKLDRAAFSSNLNKIFKFEEGWLNNWKEGGGKRRRIYKLGSQLECQKLFAQYMRSNITELFGITEESVKAEAEIEAEEIGKIFEQQPLKMAA